VTIGQVPVGHDDRDDEDEAGTQEESTPNMLRAGLPPTFQEPT
jgi:hypothetical protein